MMDYCLFRPRPRGVTFVARKFALVCFPSAHMMLFQRNNCVVKISNNPSSFARLCARYAFGKTTFIESVVYCRILWCYSVSKFNLLTFSTFFRFVLENRLTISARVT